MDIRRYRRMRRCNEVMRAQREGRLIFAIADYPEVLDAIATVNNPMTEEQRAMSDQLGQWGGVAR